MASAGIAFGQPCLVNAPIAAEWRPQQFAA
jgi:hypothetical protein